MWEVELKGVDLQYWSSVCCWAEKPDNQLVFISLKHYWSRFGHIGKKERVKRTGWETQWGGVGAHLWCKQAVKPSVKSVRGTALVGTCFFRHHWDIVYHQESGVPWVGRCIRLQNTAQWLKYSGYKSGKLSWQLSFFSRRATFTYILSVRGQNPQPFFLV